MHIQVKSLQGRPRHIDLREPVEKFPALSALAEQGDVLFSGEVVAALEVSLVDGVIRVDGRAAAQATMNCSRCLEPLERHIEVPLSLCYGQSGVPDQRCDREEVELTLSDLELIPFHGEEIDPRPEIAQELIMGLPQAVLCRENCAGLCPVCGIDLNKNTCRCEPPVFREGLARLKDFKVEPD